MIKALYQAAVDTKEMRKEAEERERARQEAERKRREWEIERINKLEEIRKEEKQLDDLLSEAEAWQKAQRIRAYVQVVRDAVIAKHGEIPAGSQAETWIPWALNHANRFDPLATHSPTILDEKSTWERSYYGY